MAVGAREVLAERLPRVVAGLVDEVHLDHAVREIARRLDGVGDAADHALAARDQAVDDHRDVVLVALLELRGLGELDQVAVDDRPREALRAELGEQVDELALLLVHDGGHDLEARALGQLDELIGDLLHGLTLDDRVALGAVRDADARPQQPQVVVDLGDGAHGRARVAVRRLLIDRNGGAQALDRVDVGPVDLAEELARVRAERLDVAALPLGEDRVERERRLPRSGQAGEDDHLVARHLQIDVSEVVHARAAHDDLVV